MTNCLITFGPIESQSNGYFVRCYQIAKCLEKIDDVIVLEFLESAPQRKVKSENKIKFVRLRTNVVNHIGVPSQIERSFTFNPMHQLKFQLYSIVHLLTSRRYIKNSRVVFVEGALLPFAIVLARFAGKKVVLDTHGVNKRLSFSYRRYNKFAFLIRTLFWHVLESFAFSLSNYYVFVSEEEKTFALSAYHISEPKAFVVPNIYSMTTRQEYSKKDIEKLKKGWHLREKVVTFVGDLTSVQNKDAVTYILSELAPSFLRTKPDISFLIIGKGKENFNCTLSNVVFTGYVHDIAPFLELSDVCIAPLRVGCGVKTKVLQYLAHGKPIVASPVGIEGIEVEKPNAIIESDIATFEKALAEAMQILGSLKKVAVYNRELFERKYSNRSFQANFERCINHVTESI